MKYKTQKAFTLAEVLVTLAIIGVIASLTVPSIIKSSTNAEAAAKVKKYQSILNQVIKQYMADNDCIGNLAGCTAFASGYQHNLAWSELSTSLKVVKECGTVAGQGCFAQGVMYKLLNGDDYDVRDDAAGAKGILADGVSINIYDNNGNCNTDRSRDDVEPLTTVCGHFYVDINGPKGPNQVGRDYFVWAIVKSGVVYPYGSLDELISTTAAGIPHCDPTDSGDYAHPGGGMGCAGRIIQEGAVNY